MSERQKPIEDEEDFSAGLFFPKMIHEDSQ